MYEFVSILFPCNAENRDRVIERIHYLQNRVAFSIVTSIIDYITSLEYEVLEERKTVIDFAQ